MDRYKHALDLMETNSMRKVEKKTNISLSTLKRIKKQAKEEVLKVAITNESKWPIEIIQEGLVYDCLINELGVFHVPREHLIRKSTEFSYITKIFTPKYWFSINSYDIIILSRSETQPFAMWISKSKRRALVHNYCSSFFLFLTLVSFVRVAYETD